tara:strand:- start:1843 stop:2793 length:951 start_codon:yes stop_codon:yes gene_type:complete
MIRIINRKKILDINKVNFKKKWMISHAQCPYLVKFPKFFRIYFSTRERKSKEGNFISYSSYADFDKKNFLIKNVSKKPIISLGSLGEFNEFGNMLGSVIKEKKKYLMYFCGWTRKKSVPFDWAIGIAKSNNGSNFNKIFRSPIVTSKKDNSFLNACPMVYKFRNKFFMYFLSGVKWIKYKNRLEPIYKIKFASSNDGFNWKILNKNIIKSKTINECQTSPSIFYYKKKYHMIFSYRKGFDYRKNSNNSYKLGYSISSNLVNWKRKDKILKFSGKLEKEIQDMQCYPNVFSIKNKFKILFCGNNFGKKGFFIADLKI